MQSCMSDLAVRSAWGNWERGAGATTLRNTVGHEIHKTCHSISFYFWQGTHFLILADGSIRGTAFAFIFGVNWLWRWSVTASFMRLEVLNVLGDLWVPLLPRQCLSIWGAHESPRDIIPSRNHWSNSQSIKFQSSLLLLKRFLLWKITIYHSSNLSPFHIANHLNLIFS